jgi:serine/threonine kinase PknH
MPGLAARKRIGFAVALVSVVLAGTACDRTIDGSAQFAAGAAPTNLPLVKIDALPNLIPTLDQAAKAMDAPPFEIAGVYDGMEPLTDAKLSDPSCEGAVFGIVESVYRGSNYQGVYGQLTGTAGGQNNRSLDQGVVAMSSAEDAQTFVDTQVDAWKRCTGKPLTVTVEGQQVIWTASAPIRSYGVPVLHRTQQGVASYACSHALAARSNIVADVVACSDDEKTINDQAAALVNMSMAKIPG